MGVQTIDMTPSWEGLLPYLLTLVQDGTIEARRIAMDELRRMAKLADRHVEAHRIEAAA